LLGALYYVTAVRYYSTKATLLFTQSGRDQMDPSIASDRDNIQANMFTFEKILRSSKVLEEAGKKLAPSERIDFPSATGEAVSGALECRLTTKVIKNTNVMEVSYLSKDPQVAANVVSTVVQAYLDFMDVVHKGTAGEISKVLTRELNDVAEKLAKKQEEMIAARRNLADIGIRSEGKTLHPLVQRAIYFNDTLIAVQKEGAECEAALASLRATMESNGDIAQCINTIAEVLGSELLLSNAGISGKSIASRDSIQEDLLKARAEMQTLEQNLGQRHPDVVALAAKIRMLEDFLQTARLGNGGMQPEYLRNQFAPWLLQMLESKLVETKQRETVFQGRFEEARTAAVELNGQLVQVELLERDIKRLADMSDVLLNQIASLNLKQNGQDIRVAVIEEPKVNYGPVSPRSGIVVVASIGLGLLISLVVVMICDALNDRFRSMEELQDRLKLTLLAVIWRLKPPGTKGLQSIAMHATPNAPESEGFRTLRTALGMTNEGARQILVSSSESGDGKTTTMANLATCYAQSDKRVLVIDADLHRMGLSKLFEMRGISGLSEILRRSEDIETMAGSHIRPSGIPNLDVLPAGPRPSNPSELLAGPRLSQLLSWAGAIYDYIFIDSTPALITADPAIIAQVVDGVIFVVQPAKNRRQMISHMVERFRLLKIPLLGLIVNAAGSEEEAYYGNKSYGTYGSYGAYGKYGGYGDNDTEEQEYAAETCEEAPRAPHIVPAWSEEEYSPPLTIPRRVA
jgi:capsular exopolysaccharide synthesis family protein